MNKYEMREKIARIVAPHMRGVSSFNADAETVETNRQYALGIADSILAALDLTEEWMPIETAPKDGTTILVARYDETFGWVRGTSQWVDDLGGNWLSRGVRGVADGLGLAHPTHWKPFDPPPPPSTGGE